MTTNKLFIDKKPMIKIIGITHISPNIQKTINTLNKLNLKKNSIIFLEPQKGLLLGKEEYKDSSVENYFLNISNYITNSNAKIIPINKSNMPSHSENIYYKKLAKQLAEEEYMSNVIDISIKNNIDFIESNDNNNIIIMIGNNHAKRLQTLLMLKNYNTSLTSISQDTPDDIFTRYLKNAIENNMTYVKYEWLDLLNSKLKEKLNINFSIENIQKICWNDNKKYEKYITLSKRLMQVYPKENYMEKLPQNIFNECINIKEKTANDLLKNQLSYYDIKEEHPIMRIVRI